MGQTRRPDVRPIDLNAARVLLGVVQAGSFRGAAVRLQLPKSTVSRKLAELEARLGAQLLRRTTRRIALTDAGAIFVEQAGAALAQLEEAERQVAGLSGEPRGVLRVSASVPSGQLFLVPLLRAFLDAHPGVSVALQLTDRHVDLVAEGIDVAMRVGPLPDSTLVARRVGESVYRVVASPRYLGRNGRPERPADLAAHHCLRFARSGSPARSVWPFGRGRRATEVSVAGRLVADDLMVLREAAIAGQGIARLPSLLVGDALRRRRLVSLLDEDAPPATPLFLVHAGDRHLPPRTRAFLDFAAPRLARILEQHAG